ncbi:MAG: transcriptional regulator [Devosia sp.]|uniref:LuxR family transcriptional regulator n=1 Tax=Devosia sp. TaxID=1871048 RepID=UPI0026352AC5|nr:LuxR family transcriptional regulator [Devosia sp.]MDB5540742.1 transcriptional regulator [Devosia sp.]
MTTKHLLEAIHDFSACSSAADIVEIIARATASFGAEFFCFNYFPCDGRDFSDAILTSRLPSAWLDLYLASEFAEVDPSIRHCRNVVRPFAWDTAPFDPECEPQAREVVERAKDFRLSKGLLVPIPSPVGCIGDVWIGGYDFDLPEAFIPSIHMIALYGFASMHRLLAPTAPKSVKLTERECEILRWVAAGKSAKEIGRLLNRSHRTIEWHLQAVVAKLGAANRAQAVMIALRDRLIDI